MASYRSLRDFDWTLLVFVLIMSVISVLEIRSATATTKFHGFQVKQLEFIVFGLVLMFVVSAIDYHRLLDIAPWAYGISIVSLIAVKVVGQKVLGARRWINLGGGVASQRRGSLHIREFAVELSDLLLKLSQALIDKRAVVPLPGDREARRQLSRARPIWTIKTMSWARDTRTRRAALWALIDRDASSQAGHVSPHS